MGHDKDETGHPLTESTNVVLASHLSMLHLSSIANFGLATLSLIYGAHNVVMLFLNANDHNDDDCGDPDDSTIPRCGSSVSDQGFHRLDLWPTFAFSLVTAFCFRTSPKSRIDGMSLTAVRIILALEIGLAFVAAMLVTLDLNSFEVLAHEIEYVNEFIRTLIDVFFLSTLLKSMHPKGLPQQRWMGPIVASAQLVSYNFLGKNGELISHYFEFVNGIASSGVRLFIL